MLEFWDSVFCEQVGVCAGLFFVRGALGKGTLLKGMLLKGTPVRRVLPVDGASSGAGF